MGSVWRIIVTRCRIIVFELCVHVGGGRGGRCQRKFPGKVTWKAIPSTQHISECERSREMDKNPSVTGNIR